MFATFNIAPFQIIQEGTYRFSFFLDDQPAGDFLLEVTQNRPESTRGG